MMKYYIVDAFTDLPFGGNPAGVVLLEGDAFPPETMMMQMAISRIANDGTIYVGGTAYVLASGEFNLAKDE